MKRKILKVVRNNHHMHRSHGKDDGRLIVRDNASKKAVQPHL